MSNKKAEISIMLGTITALIITALYLLAATGCAARVSNYISPGNNQELTLPVLANWIETLEPEEHVETRTQTYTIEANTYIIVFPQNIEEFTTAAYHVINEGSKQGIVTIKRPNNCPLENSCVCAEAMQHNEDVLEENGQYIVDNLRCQHVLDKHIIPVTTRDDKIKPYVMSNLEEAKNIGIEAISFTKKGSEITILCDSIERCGSIAKDTSDDRPKWVNRIAYQMFTANNQGEFKQGTNGAPVEDPFELIIISGHEFDKLREDYVYNLVETTLLPISNEEYSEVNVVQRTEEVIYTKLLENSLNDKKLVEECVYSGGESVCEKWVPDVLSELKD